MQAFPRVSFFGGILSSAMRTFSVLLPRQPACGVFRESLRGDIVTETLGKLFHSYEKQHGVGGRWSSDHFHLAHTVRPPGAICPRI